MYNWALEQLFSFYHYHYQSVVDAGYSATSAATADLPESLSHVRNGGDARRMSDELRHTDFTFSHAINLSSPYLFAAVSLLCMLLLLLRRLVT